MDFGRAIESLKRGEKVSRSGWNGVGMWLFLVQGSKGIVTGPPLLGLYLEGTECVYQPYVVMKTAQGTIVPWACSQSDMLAGDWGTLA